ncbi:MAG: YceI family protein [Pseudomonadota bacterium]
MMTTNATARLATLILCLAAFTPPAHADTQRYALDMSHTDIHFSIMRFGFNRVIGHFRDAEGVIDYDANDVANSSVSVTIQTASIESGDETQDGHLQGEFWLNTAAHPTMTFQSTAVSANDDGTLTVTGDLTMLGKTLSVALLVTINKTGTDPATKRAAMGVTIKTNLDRADYGLTTAANLIANDVHVHIEALALADGA